MHEYSKEEKEDELMADTFDGVKTAYISCREQQRQFIMAYKDLTPKNQGNCTNWQLP